MLAYTGDDVRELNLQARTLRLQPGELGRSESVDTTSGAKDFAVGDRFCFRRNEKSLGVKNGSLGTIEEVRGGVLQVKLDAPTEARVAVDTSWYAISTTGMPPPSPKRKAPRSTARTFWRPRISIGTPPMLRCRDNESPRPSSTPLPTSVSAASATTATRKLKPLSKIAIIR